MKIWNVVLGAVVVAFAIDHLYLRSMVGAMDSFLSEMFEDEETSDVITDSMKRHFNQNCDCSVCTGEIPVEIPMEDDDPGVAPLFDGLTPKQKNEMLRRRGISERN